MFQLNFNFEFLITKVKVYIAILNIRTQNLNFTDRQEKAP